LRGHLRGAEATGRRRDPAVTSRILRAVRGRDTKPELVLRRALHRRGLRFRTHYAVAGRPDIVFPSRRLAIFVDGDFWHGRGYHERGFATLEEQFRRWNRGAWWLEKIRSNVARDRRVTRKLRREGWVVMRFRDSAVARSLERCVAEVAAALERL